MVVLQQQYGTLTPLAISALYASQTGGNTRAYRMIQNLEKGSVNIASDQRAGLEQLLSLAMLNRASQADHGLPTAKFDKQIDQIAGMIEKLDPQAAKAASAPTAAAPKGTQLMQFPDGTTRAVPLAKVPAAQRVGAK
jgi:hypothetical protein